MSRQMRFHIYHLILWLIVTIGFLIAFSSGKTIENWGDNPKKTLLVAILFVIGYGGDTILRYIFRKKKDRVEIDERDLMIQHRSLMIAFIMVLLYAFLLTITLYIRFEAVGFVPVGWLWFIAYSLILAANVFSSTVTLFHYVKGGK